MIRNLKNKIFVLNAKVLRTVVSLIIVCFVPALLLTGLNRFLASEEAQARSIETSRQMFDILGQVSMLSEPMRKFDASFRTITENFKNTDALLKQLEELQNRNPNAIELYLFNEKGEITPIPFMPPPPRFVSQRFLQSTIDPAAATGAERWNMQFTGYSDANVTLHNNPDSIIFLGGSHNRHWGGWFRLYDHQNELKGHLIVFILKSGIDEDNLICRAIDNANLRYSEKYTFAWQEPAVDDQLMPESVEMPKGFLHKTSKVAHGKSSFEFKQRPAAKIYTNSGACLYALANNEITIAGFFRFIDFLIITLAAIVSIMMIPFFYGKASTAVRKRMIALLAFGTGLPLVILFFTGYVDRSDREKILVEEFRNRNLRDLNNIDEGLLYQYRQLENTFFSTIEDYNKFSDDKFESEIKKIGEHFTNFRDTVTQVLVVKDENIVLWRANDNTTTVAKHESTMDFYGEMLLDIYRGDFYSTEDYTPGDLRSIVRSTSIYFARNVLLAIGKIDRLRFLDSIILTYVDLFLDLQEHARAVMFVYLSREAIQSRYISSVSIARDNNLQPETTRFAAVPVTLSDRWPSYPRPSTARYPILRELAEKVTARNLPEHQIAEVAGSKYLLSAIRGNLLDGYVLIAASPYKNIDREIDLLNKQMIAFAMFIILTSWFLARLTSKQLLNPLEELKKVLIAINSGDFRYRAKGSNVKEFSLMLSTLNRTLESFQEMQVAKNVQSHLWPEKSLGGDNWQLSGKCTPATDLGGDHFDWLELEDKRIFFAIGDVTGHGIAPAMIQATTKVWSALKAVESKSAADFIEQINKLHCKFGVKKLKMTFWAGYFNPETGELDYSSAGHNYPVLVSKDGNAQFIKLPGIPLGVRAKSKFVSEKLIIEPGSSIILYTDGIVEAKSESGEMFGYDRLLQKCALTCQFSSQQAVDYLLKAARDWALQDDDETVIVLKVS